MGKTVLTILGNQEAGWVTNIMEELGPQYSETSIIDDIDSAIDRIKKDRSICAVISGTMGDDRPFEEILKEANIMQIPFILLTGRGTQAQWNQIATERDYGSRFSVFFKENFRDGKPFVDHFETVINPTHGRPELK